MIRKKAHLAGGVDGMCGAVIYLRVSTSMQVDGQSLETQERSCVDVAARLGVRVLRVFREEGRSAKTISGRPVFKEAIRFCEANKGLVSFFIVYSTSRFARSAMDLLKTIEQLRGLGVLLRSATEPIDESPTGKFMTTNLGAMAELDNALKSQVVKDNMIGAASEGRFTHRAPTGYLNNGGGTPSLVHDPERAALVKFAFETLATGRCSKREVLREVTARGLRTRGSGRPLGDQQFHEMLINPCTWDASSTEPSASM